MAACAVGVSGVVKSLGSTGRLRGFLVPWAQEESKIWTGVSLPCPGACGSWVHHRLECSAWFLTLLTETASVSVKSPRGSSIAFHGGWGREARSWGCILPTSLRMPLRTWYSPEVWQMVSAILPRELSWEQAWLCLFPCCFQPSVQWGHYSGSLS